MSIGGNDDAPHNCITFAWVALRCWPVRALVLSRVQADAAEPVHMLVPTALLLGRRYNRAKKTKAEAGAIGGASKDQNDTCLPSTADRLAAEHGVSPATVKRAAAHAPESWCWPVPRNAAWPMPLSRFQVLYLGNCLTSALASRLKRKVLLLLS